MNVIVAGDGVMAVRVVRALMRNNQVVCIQASDGSGWQLDQLDAEVISGDLTSPQVLEEARVSLADVFIACSRSDEQNIVASIAAKRLGAKRTICVLLRRGFLSATTDGSELANSLGIDEVVRPVDQLTEEMVRIVMVPGALEVEELAGGLLSLLRYAVEAGAPATKLPLKDLALPAGTLLVHVRRGDDFIVPRGNTRLQAGDKVIAMGLPTAQAGLGHLVRAEGRRPERKEVTIVGGGRVGRGIATRLVEAKWQVKIIEVDRLRCENISQEMPALVLHGDGGDVEFLEQEQVGESAVVVTVTNSDEKNLLVSLLVKQLGNPRIITRADRLANERMFEKVGVDVVRSAKGAAIRTIVRQIDQKESVIHAELEHGAACVLELTVPDQAEAMPVSQLSPPAYSVVGAILRDGKAIVPSGRDTLQGGDHLFVFCARDDENEIRRYYTHPHPPRREYD